MPISGIGVLSLLDRDAYHEVKGSGLPTDEAALSEVWARLYKDANAAERQRMIEDRWTLLESYGHRRPKGQTLYEQMRLQEFVPQGQPAHLEHLQEFTPPDGRRMAALLEGRDQPDPGKYAAYVDDNGGRSRGKQLSESHDAPDPKRYAAWLHG